MRTSLPVDDAAYLADYLYVKAREVWPAAVILDRKADVRFCRSPMQPGGEYGFDIFRSENEIEQLLSEDCCPPPPSVNVSLSAGTVNVSGPDDVVLHLAKQPLWSSS